MYKLAVLNTHPIQYFAPFYRRLAKEPDIDLTVYFCSQQGVLEYLDDGFGQRIKWDVSLLDGYEHRFLKNWRRHDRVGGFWSLVNPGVISELRRHRYDALIVNGHNHATYLIAMLAARLLGTSVLMRCDTHLLLRRSAFKLALRKPLMGFIYRTICSFCLPIGTRNKEFYLANGVSEDKLVLIPFAVDNEHFSSGAAEARPRNVLKREARLPEEKGVVLFASKLIARKRPMDLLQAFEAARRRGLQSSLVFVGSGDQEQSLKTYVSVHGVPDVYFFGFRNQSELPDFFTMADVFVLPSEDEPWGLILNEVMCAGLPIIAAEEIGAVPDLVKHGVNGFVYPSQSIAELCDRILEMMNHAEMRSEMGKASQRIINGWDYESSVAGIREVLARTRPAIKALEERPAA